MKTRRIAIAMLSAAALLLLALGMMFGCAPAEGQKEEKEVAGITLELKNARTEFYVGDSFSAVGVGVRVSYADGSSELKLIDPADDDFALLPPDMTSVGRKEVSVSYRGMVKKYSVVVSRIDALELDLAGVPRGFTVGETFSAEGLAAHLTVTTVDAAGQQVSATQALAISSLKVTAPALDAPGVKEVAVSYGELSRSYSVYVVPDVDKVISFSGENDLSLFVTEGTGGSSSKDGSAKGWYLLRGRDGTFAMSEVSATYTASTGAYAFTGTVATTVSGDLVEAVVGGKTYTADLRVCQSVMFGWPKQIVGFYLDATGAKRGYRPGDAFSQDGLKVMAIYSDNTADEAQGGTLSVTPPTAAEMQTQGVKTVSVSYTATNGMQFDFEYQIYCIPAPLEGSSKLEFGADGNGSGATLDLFILSRSAESGTWGVEQNVTGILLLTNADGSYELYDFSFYLDASVVSHCYPDGAPAGVTSYLIPDDQIGGGNLVIEIGEMKFTATDNNLWHLVVIGWQ